MKIVQVVQRRFELLGICSNQSRLNGSYVMTWLVYVIGTASSTVFLIHGASSFLEYTNNLYMTTALWVGYIYFTIMFFKMEKLFILIDNVEKVLDKRSENPISKAIYDHTNQLVEKITQIGYVVIATVSPMCIVCPKALVSYYMYFAADMDNETFELPLFYWFPFDWRNPFGYFVAVSFQYITIACHFKFLACVALLGVGDLLFALSIIEDTKIDLKSINRNAKLPQNRLETLKQFSDIVQFHSTSKQYVCETVDFYQPVLILVYMWSLVTICGVMLLVQMEIVKCIEYATPFVLIKLQLNVHDFGQQGNGSLALMLATIFYVFYAFGIVLTICELGQRLTDAFGEIENEVNAFDYNLFSPEIQNLLRMMLIGAQQPVVICIFGSTSSQRDTFKKVVNSAFSYFTVIRQFLK